MKNIALLLVFLLCTSLLYSQSEPKAIFYKKDGTRQLYKLSEIKKMKIKIGVNEYTMKVYYQNSLSNEYQTASIDSMKFEFNNNNIREFNIYISGTAQSYIVSEIDSVVFFISECRQIQIGNQIWMCKNLDVATYRNGDTIPQVTDPTEWVNLTTGAWCYYADSDWYGRLYNWYAVNDPRGLAPNGWHIPSDDEWKTLELYLGLPLNEVDNLSWRGANVNVGGKLKEAGTLHWTTPNTGATNESIFTALPMGFRTNTGQYGSYNLLGFWWSSTSVNENNGYCRALSYVTSQISRNSFNKIYGLSVRCIKNEKDPPEILNITPESGKVGDVITITGKNFGNERNINYISFNGTIATEYLSWCDTLITVIVPENATSGYVIVYVDDMYSNQVDFTVECEIQIGNQIWMCNNLDLVYYQNGDPIPQVTDATEWANLQTGAWCYYNNDSDNGDTYGILYNWAAVNDPRGLAPEGWHIPRDDEWKTLELFLGMSQEEADQSGFRGEDANVGGKLKEIGTTLWNAPNSGATNESGFSGIPGGYRTCDNGEFESIGNYGYYWTSTYGNATNSWGRILCYDNSSVFRSYCCSGYGFFVRCLKNGLPPEIMNITPNEGKIGDVITITGNNFGFERGNNFVSFNGVIATNYQSWSNTEIVVIIPIQSTSGNVRVNVYGQESNGYNFTIVPGCTGRESYSEVTIGNQIWMGENLDVCRYRNGDEIPQVTDATEWANLTTGAWCYYNNVTANGLVYGKLYNWYAVNDPRGLAPDGWHIPTDEEWTNLELYLGMPEDDIDYWYQGEEENVGGKLKETGTSHWFGLNTGATNESGFTGLPGGNRDYFGTFSYLRFYGFWWTSTDYDANNAFFRQLYYDYRYVYMWNSFKKYGFSVRCVKDE